MKKIHLFILLVLTIMTFVSMGIKKAQATHMDVHDIVSHVTVEQVVVPDSPASQDFYTVSIDGSTNKETTSTDLKSAPSIHVSPSYEDTRRFSEFVVTFLALTIAVCLSLFLPLRERVQEMRSHHNSD